MPKKFWKQHHSDEQAPVVEQETVVEPVPAPLPFPGNPATHRPGAAGVHGDPFPERANLVPDTEVTTLQQTELPANPVVHSRLVPRYYDGPDGA